MKRLFIAVPLPHEIRTILHGMGRSLPGAKSVSEEQIHVTLRFIGEVNGSTFLDIRQSLLKIKDPAFKLGIKGVGHFPPRGKPRVIWAGVHPFEQIAQLKNKVDNCLKECGLEPDKRKFAPHITLARLKTTSLQKVTEFLAGNAFLHFDEFEINSFILYSSNLSYKGAIHTVEDEYILDSS